MAQPAWLTSAPIAHRGLHDARAGRPENSLSAFELAAAYGIPIELDVQRGGDDQLVVVHDRDVGRVTGEHIPVAELSRRDLRRLRLESSDQPIPRLSDVLELVGGRTPILVDVRRWGIGFDVVLARHVLAEIDGYEGPLALQSFDPLTVGFLRLGLRKRHDNTWPVGQVSGLLHSARFPISTIGRTMITNWLTRPDFITFELAALPSRHAERWRHRLNVPLIAFTVENAEDEQRATRLADNFVFDGYIPKAYVDKINQGREDES